MDTTERINQIVERNRQQAAGLKKFARKHNVSTSTLYIPADLTRAEVNLILRLSEHNSIGSVFTTTHAGTKCTYNDCWELAKRGYLSRVSMAQTYGFYLTEKAQTVIAANN